MTADPDATKEENYYNSESEGKEFNRKEISKRLKQIYKEREEVYNDYDEKYDAYVQATCEETFGKENCHEETYSEDFWQEYHNNTKEKKNNS
jgi:hypothetical protein